MLSSWHGPGAFQPGGDAENQSALWNKPFRAGGGGSVPAPLPRAGPPEPGEDQTRAGSAGAEQGVNAGRATGWS